MSLLNLAVSHVLDTSSNDLIVDFFVPALAQSVRYDRGVGYFSSGWLRLTAQGMVGFARGCGRARWITSPILSTNDWEALNLGDSARSDPVLHAAISGNIQDLQKTLEQETLSALAWMVADEILTFKLALPTKKLAGGDFHDKFGIFTDKEGNQLSFNGSYNESVQGTRNYESIKIFPGWNPGFASFVQDDIRRFERLWNNQDTNVLVFDLPDAAKAQILQLRQSERPYPEPEWVKRHRLNEQRAKYQPAQPVIPSHIQIRDYQEEAIAAWFAHNCQGLFEMATGTGKTITALAASAQLYQREQRLAVIITVPYQHLVTQWNDEASAFGYKAILAFQNKNRWLEALNHEILEFNGGYRSFVSVITTHTTFITPEFQETINRLTGPTLILADEAHHLGAERSRQNYPHQIPFRLALSATPDRWFDDAGTIALREYFGTTVFSFPLEKAIGVSLTPYYYYPHLVPLTDDEMAEYEALSVKIARLVNQLENEKQEALKMLLIKRANLLNKAANKLEIYRN